MSIRVSNYFSFPHTGDRELRFRLQEIKAQRTKTKTKVFSVNCYEFKLCSLSRYYLLVVTKKKGKKKGPTADTQTV